MSFPASNPCILCSQTSHSFPLKNQKIIDHINESTFKLNFNTEIPARIYATEENSFIPSYGGKSLLMCKCINLNQLKPKFSRGIYYCTVSSGFGSRVLASVTHVATWAHWKDPKHMEWSKLGGEKQDDVNKEFKETHCQAFKICLFFCLHQLLDKRKGPGSQHSWFPLTNLLDILQYFLPFLEALNISGYFQWIVAF